VAVGKTAVKPRAVPPKSERERFRSLLPDLNDGGRWTVENEGNGWKFRRLYKDNPSKRYGSLLWRTWELMNERYDHEQIRGILAAKVAARQREQRAA
jgi:hypothetical protein